MKRWIVCILALLVALSGCAAREVSPSVQTETISDAAPEALPEAMEEPADEPEAPADELTCAGEVWMKNAALTVSGELRADGAVSIERGRVEITDGTVYLAEGLWLGEGDVVVSGGEVIVPGGLDALCCDHGEVLVTGGTVREP